MEAAHVFPVSDAQGPDHFVFFVETVGITEGGIVQGDVGGFDPLTEERGTIHLIGDLDTGQVQYRRAEVDEADETGLFGSGFFRNEMLPFFRNADHQRDMETGFVDVAFSPGQDSAVIAEVKDKRVFEEAVLFQPGDCFSNNAVDGLNVVEVAGVGIAEERCVRKVGRKNDFIRIVLCRVVLIGLQ